MTSITDKAHPKALAPAIREVCLIGSPARRYLHIALIDVGQGCRDVSRRDLAQPRTSIARAES